MPLSREEEIMRLFEGKCHQCEAAAEPVRASGTKLFQTMQPWAIELPDFHPWDEDRGLGDGMDAIGSVDFVCEMGHKGYVEFGPFGDWL